MKRLFFILISFIFYMNCLAQEIIILLYRDAPKDQPIDDRSLSMEPTVSHDRNVIYIHSDIAIENMQITIRDKYKDIIYTNQLTILQSQNYSFSFNSPGEKEFTIELSYKDINLQGHFTID